MRSFLDNIQKRIPIPSAPMKDDLPISQSPNGGTTHLIGLRRRIISSFSVKIQPFSSSAACSWAALRRSKSAPEFAEDQFSRGTIRRWWDWSWAWLLSKKPVFARDLEMNEEEAAMLGCHSKGTLRHLFHKIRSEIRKIVPASQGLPTTNARFRYDSISYAHNFDDGNASGQL
ncbi:hypothetical protein KSP40_PGU020865 [Platanthera guangdongensis]|uniref:SAM domain-containing protein n=1 Tax=Platanthera guangdongensis TaxID=2320717 RepID=A0ABR2MGV0_9ASPA